MKDILLLRRCKKKDCERTWHRGVHYHRTWLGRWFYR